MGKVEDALRDFIQYHGKRVAGEVVGEVPDQLRQARQDIRELQRTVADLVGKVEGLIEFKRSEMAVPPAPEEELEGVRFSKRTLPSIRKRLDLTQQELADLLEVSPATVTSWETGKSRPRQSNLAQIVTLREMDQAEVDEALGREPAPEAMKPEQLKRLRKKHDLIQAELAALIGVSPASITSWESGKTSPSRENRRAIANVAAMARAEVDLALNRHEEGGKGRPKTREPELSPEEIRSLRDSLGLSQRALAEKIGVSPNSISNWETGSTEPRKSSIARLRELRDAA